MIDEIRVECDTLNYMEIVHLMDAALFSNAEHFYRGPMASTQVLFADNLASNQLAVTSRRNAILKFTCRTTKYYNTIRFRKWTRSTDWNSARFSARLLQSFDWVGLHFQWDSFICESQTIGHWCCIPFYGQFCMSSRLAHLHNNRSAFFGCCQCVIYATMVIYSNWKRFKRLTR